MSKAFVYYCPNCDKEYPGTEIIYLCPGCSNNNSLPPKGVLRVIYDYLDIPQESDIFRYLISTGFIDLLPIRSLNSLPPLRIGNTPLYAFKRFAGKPLPFELLLKDDSLNPTFSFKDRASALVSAFAKEHGQNTIIAASTGNAGSSLAGICASQGQKAIIVVPSGAPVAKLTQILMYGATIIPILGTYDDAFELSIQATREFGWYNRNTAFNPLTIEGKKTVAFELFQQMNGRLPDRIFVPVGDGVIISGVYRGFEDLFILNLSKKFLLSLQCRPKEVLILSAIFRLKNSKSGKAIPLPIQLLLIIHGIFIWLGATSTITLEKRFLSPIWRFSMPRVNCCQYRHFHRTCIGCCICRNAEILQRG